MSHPAPTLVRPLSVALPIAEAEDLIASLPGVISACIIESETGGAGDVHVLTGTEVPAKQTVRNVESALLARFGVRIDHRKISVATTTDGARARTARPTPSPVVSIPAVPAPVEDLSRRVCFDDVEVRRSSRTAQCRVTLRQGTETVAAEAESLAGARAHTEELAARATLTALSQLSPDATVLSLEGAQVVQAFGREFVFVGVSAPQGRSTALLAGSAEVRDSVEIAAALAVLDATNRWVGRAK